MRQFSGPIPGQSLTTTPKNFPWERPPEIVDPEEAIQMHLTRLSDPKKLKAALDLMELEDLDIQTLTKGLMRGAVSQGIHTIDVGLIVAPVVHEYLKQAAKYFGIPAKDGFEDATAEEEKRQAIAAAKARKMMKTAKAEPKKVVEEIKQEEPQVEAPRRGLMAKGDM